MIICPNCNFMNVPDDAQICPKCHNRFVIYKCKDCGTQLFGNETKRCPECKKAHNEKVKRICIAGAIVLFVASGGYAILPIDVIPDAIPVAGLVDDIALLTTGSSLGIAALITGIVHGKQAKVDPTITPKGPTTPPSDTNQ